MHGARVMLVALVMGPLGCGSVMRMASFAEHIALDACLLWPLGFPLAQAAAMPSCAEVH